MKIESILKRVRALCLVLPETSERPSHGAPTFFIREKKSFVMFMNDHHGDGRLALWLAAPPGAQEALIARDPERFFRPPYVGSRGWAGVRLDLRPDWDDVAALVREAYDTIVGAPRGDGSKPVRRTKRV
jgi:predicted DNA-binding protein (MmcQ/YjbR family)